MRPTAFALLLLPVLFSTGCRTYGGHGTEAASYVAIERAVAWGEMERTRLSNDEMAFYEAAARMPFLEDFSVRIEELSASLTGRISDWEARAAAIDETSAYRTLNAVLGSIVAERQRYEDRYRRLVADMAKALAGDPPGPGAASRYQVAPAHYERLASRLDDVRIRDLIAVAE